jgi:hypothetical protein
MSETGNIEELAKIISNDIFKWFKWETRPLKDSDWSCVLDYHHKKTHPADVVFYYNDPYTGETIYINTDLKSYKKDSITITSISKALKSLSIAVECANISEDWQHKYLVDDGKVVGLLFIYNHDNEFDKELSSLVESVNFEKDDIPENVSVFIFEPNRIRNFLNIITDIKGLIADNSLPQKDYTFFYPDLIMSKRHGDEWHQPASLEALTSPWLIIKHKKTEEAEEGYLIYYHKEGETIEEFIYLIDAMSHYQMLLSDKLIRIRFTNACKEAAINFDKAKLKYLEIWGFDETRKIELNKIEARNITQFVSKYCPMEIGMR